MIVRAIDRGVSEDRLAKALNLDVRALRRRHRLKLFGAGVTIAFLLTVPVVNLLTPVIATVFMVHVFHGLRRTGP